MKLKIEIKNRWTGKVIFEFETENNTIRKTVEEAIKSGADLSKADLSKADLSKANLSKADLSWANLSKANLSKANLSKANLSEANLSWANLSWADLSKADLSKADLSEANLSWANLSGADLSKADLSKADLSEADLSKADLSVIKADFFYVLLHSKHEISYLKQALIDGKIDGSTYSGECACLSGTVEKGAIKNNGPQEQTRKYLIYSCRSSSRPAERFFLAIRPNNTPENNQAAKIVMEWIEEFERLISL